MESGLEGRHDGRRGRPDSLSERASPRFLPPLRTFSAGPRNDGVEGVGLGAGVRDGLTVWGYPSLDPSEPSCLISPSNTSRLDILDQCGGCRRHESKPQKSEKWGVVRLLRQAPRDCPYGGMDSGSGAGMSGVTGVHIWGRAIPESPLREGMDSRVGARDSWGKRRTAG